MSRGPRHRVMRWKLQTMHLYKSVRFQESKDWGIKKSSQQGAIRGSINLVSMKAAEESKTP